jgi:hypothetical protein
MEKVIYKPLWHYVLRKVGNVTEEFPYVYNDIF